MLPFARFPGVDTLLGPEMRSTGEDGLGPQLPARLPESADGGVVAPLDAGLVYVSIRDTDKSDAMAQAARDLTAMGFTLVATRGTAEFLARRWRHRDQDSVNKVYEGRPEYRRPSQNGEIVMVLNTTEGAQAIADLRDIRAVALNDKIPYFTTAAGAASPPWPRSARAARVRVGVRSLQA